MKGLVADINVQGQVAYLAQRMQADTWADFWQELELVLYRFEDLGLTASSTDADIFLGIDGVSGAGRLYLP